MEFISISRFWAIMAVMVVLAITVLSLFVRQVSGDCYTPDGEPYYYHQECFLPTQGAVTACCRTLDLCLDNSLCAHIDDTGNETYYRGTCSNSPDWTLPTCPNYCKGHTEEDSHIGEWPVGKCPSDGTSVERWFCIGNETGYGTVDDCADPSFGFTLSGDTMAFWTAGIEPSYTAADTPEPAAPGTTGPGTTTLWTWRGTLTGSSSGSTSLPTVSSSSDVQLSSSSVGDPVSATSVNQSAVSTSVSKSTVSTPAGYMSAPLSSGQSASKSLDVPPLPSTFVDPSLTSLTESASIPATTTGSPATSTDNPATSIGIPTTITNYPIISFSSPVTVSPPHLLTTQSTVAVNPSPTGNPAPPASNSTAIVVGVSIGTITFLGLSVLLYTFIQRLREQAPARAETPPPYEGEPTPQPERPDQRHYAFSFGEE